MEEGFIVFGGTNCGASSGLVRQFVRHAYELSSLFNVFREDSLPLRALCPVAPLPRIQRTETGLQKIARREKRESTFAVEDMY